MAEFPLTVNKRLETPTLLPSGLVQLLNCFLSKVSIHHLLRLFYVCLLLKRKKMYIIYYKLYLITFLLKGTLQLTYSH